MASQLSAILATLATTGIAVGTDQVTALAPDALPNSVAMARLPVRVLLPTGERVASVRWSARTLGVGRVAQVEWTVSDLLLLQPVATGRGLEAVAGVLTDYIAAYMDAARQWLDDTWQVQTIRAAVGTYAYPVGGQTQYYGVLAEVTLSEIVQ